MTDTQYALTQERLLLVARMVSSMDLDGFLQRIEQAETAAPILDPTLYARGGARLDAIRRMAEAAREFQRAVAGTEYHLRLRKEVREQLDAEEDHRREALAEAARGFFGRGSGGSDSDDDCIDEDELDDPGDDGEEVPF